MSAEAKDGSLLVLNWNGEGRDLVSAAKDYIARPSTQQMIKDIPKLRLP